ncbi:MAG TPA: aryl-sulfate sulfotransferase [Gemmataceae bacterium]|nr:aryl-sulfate sulfotransferase [Gemmataceae bacterium]
MVRTLPARTKFGLVAVLVFLAAALAFAVFQACRSLLYNEAPEAAKISMAPELAFKPPEPVNDPRALRGYTLFAPLESKETYLIDMEGRVVHSWQTDSTPGMDARLLENGHLLRPETVGGFRPEFSPGAGGRVQELAWDGKVVWDFTWHGKNQIAHHDVCKLPNGNVLMIVSERKYSKEALAAGRKPELLGAGYLLPDCVVEVKPTGATTGAVVWEWHLWDHLVQDHAPERANYGNVAAHPELIDVNFGEGAMIDLGGNDDDAIKKLQSLGYVGASPPGKKLLRDWTHTNSVAYHAALDQVMLSVSGFSEIWIIDHSTTTAQAVGHRGGRYGKGGDLLYRWGNPQAYRAGAAVAQQLGRQHDAHWIPRGLPGEGHVLLFNNGRGRPGPDGRYSSVDEIVLPVDREGHYTLKPGAAYGPDKPVWSYSAPRKSDLFAPIMSSAQRLSNGNTLVCSGRGIIFEVTADKQTVWSYVNPVGSGPAIAGGAGDGPWADAGFSTRQDVMLTAFEVPGGAKLLEHSFANQPKATALTSTPLGRRLAFLPVAWCGDFGSFVAQGPAPEPEIMRDRAPLFRARRYAPSYPGLAGKDLRPGKKLEELQ